MSNGIIHSVKRKAFGTALHAVMKKTLKNRSEGYVGVVNAIEKINGDTWSPVAYEHLREEFSKDGKWTTFFNNLLDYVDRDYLHGLFMSFGFEGGFTGYRKVKKLRKELNCDLPWVIIFDPTSACNLKCKGCWSSEYEHHLHMSYDEMDDLVKQGKALGIKTYAMTGGEPLTRKKDIVRLAKEHYDCGFMLFTNGTLVDQQFCDDMKACKNILLSMSIEGLEDATDARRGDGVFQKVMSAMDLMHDNGLVYGTSICYTRQNVDAVTSDEFLDFLISKGVAYTWYFHFMPVGNDTSMELVPTIEQRKYMYHRVREIRDYTGGKPIFAIDFQNDGEFVHGCIAGGKSYCHINANGDVEPCVFIHYSGANIKEKPLLECLTQPLFKKYQEGQPFNDNLLRPCPMLENPAKLREIVAEVGAKSTDMMSPETAEHLCAKCDNYAKEWAPVADRLWDGTHPGYLDAKEPPQEESKEAEVA